MEIQTKNQSINGTDIINWFVSGKTEVTLNKRYLNAINVFPVADGDTGTNLSTTLKAMVDKPKRETTFSGMMRGMSESGLAHARGNSGIIFAAYVNGLALEGQSYDRVSIKDFSIIAHKAVDYLYKAIENPVEGTMISVIRDWACFLFKNHEKYESFQELFREAYKTANVSLQKTMTQLEVLRKNHIVDSGAEGFVKFLSGINHFFTGVKIEETAFEEFDIIFEEVLESNFRFCTEVFLESPYSIQNSESNEIVDKIKMTLSPYGDSLIVSSQANKLRIHIHTNTPELVVETLTKYGTILEQKADDMKLQNSVKTNKKHKIGILTDSIADLPEEFKLEQQIHTLPLGLIVDEVVYLDKLTIKPDQVFNAIKTCDTYPTSSQPEPGRIKIFLENLLDTYDSLIFIAVSSKLSNSFMAINQALKSIDNMTKKVTVIDSRLNSGAEGLMVHAAAGFLNKGLSHEEIVKEVEKLIPKTHIYVCLETLAYAVKSGRVPNTVGKLGIKLGLRPIMTLDAEGNGAAVGVGFSKKDMTRKIFKLVKKTLDTKGIAAYSIVHVGNLELANAYKDELTKQIGIEPEFITEVSSIIAIHSGLGTVAVCLTEK